MVYQRSDKIVTVWKHFLYWTWCLPQTSIGLFWFIIVKFVLRQQGESKKFLDSYHTVYKDMGANVSLGYFIFTYDSRYLKITHEYAHTRQSLLLGPLYLLVIGLPSFIWAFFFRTTSLKYKVKYTSFYTEVWAEKIAAKYRSTTP